MTHAVTVLIHPLYSDKFIEEIDIMKKIKLDKLQAGDIILTASRTKIGKGIRLSTKAGVSHAMICVQYGSIIDSTSVGVQARNLQREFFEDNEDIFAFRLREELTPVQAARVIEYARSKIGARYSKIEAARSVLGGPKPRSGRQFCSRLVASAYAYAGVRLVGDEDYCTPEDLRTSPLLTELADITETVSESEIVAWRARSDPIQMMHDAQNAVLKVARSFDANVEHFGDLDVLVRQHPEWDTAIAQVFRETGYLELWKHDLQVNPWHYDLEAMEVLSNLENLEDVRSYCIETIRVAYSGGIRFASTLASYEASQRLGYRETFNLLIVLYEKLVRYDQLLRKTSRAWLQRHFPEDVGRFMERITPHSDHWFSIVDRVEPNLGILARRSIMQEKNLNVCSSCGDPAFDYRITNSAEVMPGVPSLRLCVDCVGIRRDFGEILVPLDDSRGSTD